MDAADLYILFKYNFSRHHTNNAVLPFCYHKLTGVIIVHSLPTNHQLKNLMQLLISLKGKVANL